MASSNFLLKQASLITCIFLLCLPLFPLVSSVCFFLLAFIWLLSGRVKETAASVTGHQVFLAFIVFYTLHVASLLYSTNYNYAFFDLGEKISFLLFPFMLKAFSFSKKETARFRYFFIGGLIIASLACLAKAFYGYYNTGKTGLFFYTGFSGLMHPAYLTIYLNIALLFLADEFVSRNNRKIIITLISIFFILIVTLLASRMAWMVTLISFIVYMYIQFSRGHLVRVEKIFFLTVLASFALFQMATLKVFNRFTGVQQDIQSSSEVVPAKVTSTSTRIYLWKNAMEVISKNPLLGVGVGDVKDELIKVYVKNNHTKAAEQKLNPHNQYLQSTVALGIPGLIVLVWIFFAAFRNSFRNRDWICFLFTGIIALNCMTESILERQAGIIIFTFLLSLFFTRTNHSSQNDILEKP